MGTDSTGSPFGESAAYDFGVPFSVPLLVCRLAASLQLTTTQRLTERVSTSLCAEFLAA
jgi:hypothetical protein